MGDNIDKRITPRTMMVDNQVRSLHYFHAFTALSRVETLHLDDTKPIGDIKALPLSTFLPSAMAKKSSVVSECSIISTFIATWHQICVCIGMIQFIN